MRVCRERCDRGAIRAAVVNSGNANAATGEQGYADAVAMRERGGGRGSASTRRRVAVAETGDDRRAAADRQRCSTAIGDAAAALSAPTAAPTSPTAIMTTDRWPKRCTRARRRRDPLRPGEGRRDDPAGLRDDALLRADRRRRRGPRRARCAPPSTRSFERITVDGQMSTNDTVLLQATGAAGAPLPEGLLEAVLLQLALEIVADGEGADPGRPGRGRRAPPRRTRPSGSPGRSPTRRWSRPRSSAATRTGAGSPRRPGMALAGEDLEEIGADAIDAAELGAEVAEAEIGLRLGRGEHRAHVCFSDLSHEYIRINAEYTT